MACYSPVTVRRMPVRCGKCVGCRLDGAKEWAIRCAHEKALHSRSCFVTMTYAPEHLPPGGTLVKRHHQLFLKRVRRDLEPGALRFFLCGEYGDNGGRPHYHALLFGIDFPDQVYWCSSPAGEPLYVSDTLHSMWGMGQCLIGEITEASAAYVARYALKKAGSSKDLSRYRRVDRETGETWVVAPEYVQMSLGTYPGGGIGGPWFRRYDEDVFPSDEVVNGGRRSRVPRYYDKLLGLGNPKLLEQVKAERVARARERAGKAYVFHGDRGEYGQFERVVPTLESEKIVKLAQLGLLKRELK